MRTGQTRFFITGLLFFYIFLKVCIPVFAEDSNTSELEKEIKLGQRVAESVESHWERVNDPASIAKLRMIMNDLVPFLTRPLPYDVRMIHEPGINAFSLPGGIIYLTSGMYNSARSDNELAAVISHELVHADKKHALRQMARNRKISLVALAVMIAGKGEALPVLLSNVAQVAINNSYSRDLEQEADLIGLENLHNAGYSPSGMVTLLEVLAEEKIKNPWVDPGIYMDHPYIEERIEYIISRIRKEGWELNRKEALNVLNPSVEERENNILALIIDRTEICSGPFSSSAKKILEKAAETIRYSLQLESMPYDIKVHSSGRDAEQILSVGNTMIISEPLPDGFPSLDSLRNNLVKALLNAKKEHPVTDFLQ